MGALEAALFESGRPVLLAPPGGATKIGENILIAWNGTPEAARTVAFAKPLLRRARHVTVVTVAGTRSEEHTSELQSLMRISYAVFCLKKKNTIQKQRIHQATTTWNKKN